jgi:hypothetical protein
MQRRMWGAEEGRKEGREEGRNSKEGSLRKE